VCRRYAANLTEQQPHPKNVTFACPSLFPSDSFSSAITTTESALAGASHIESQAVVYRRNALLPAANRTVIRVSAVTTGVGGCDWLSKSHSCDEIFTLVRKAGDLGTDLLVLPEEFAGTVPMPGCAILPGITNYSSCALILALAPLAKKYNM
jgi:hypothetical protein